MAVKNKKHAERRALIEAERAERRAIEEEMRRARAAAAKKKSRSIPVKWYRTGGIRIGGVAIRGGKFYGGSNMENMVEPLISEPSRLCPTQPVAESSEDADPIPAYPCYDYITPEQRRAYLEFLASDRTETSDIGYVFLYFYGLERRLLLDTTKPGEVSEEEREELVDEMLRLLDVFGPRSRSLCHYIGSALLYDGSVFDRFDADGIREMFGIDDLDADRMKLLENSDNSPAMAYMLVSKMTERKMDVPVELVVAAGKDRLLRSNNFLMLGISQKDLYTKAFDKMLLERANGVKLNRESAPPRKAGKVNYPRIYPASAPLRNRHQFEVNGKVAKDPEEMGIPLRKIADMAVSCRKELDEFEEVVESSSKRGIEEVALDALLAASPENCALDTFLYGKKNAVYAPLKIFDEDFRRRFATPLTYTAKGVLTSQSQQMISVTAAAYGWQAMLPETIESPISGSWKLEKDDRVIMFRRGTAHDNRNGRRCLGPIFGGDTASFHIVLPGSWNDPTRLSYIFAWFIDRCSDSLSSKDLMRYSATYNPKWASTGIVDLQKLLFYSLRYATYSLSLSTHGIKSCLSAVDFEDVQDLLFSLVNDMFGNIIPNDVMSALEEIYSKAGHDKSMVLYDYHAGSYHVVKDKTGDVGFSIDEDKLAETIADTSNVHTILNEAMNTGTEDEIILESDSRIEQSPVEDEPEVSEEVASVDGGDEDVENMIEIVKRVFGGEDEAETSSFFGELAVELGLASSAEAMSWVADLNAAAGEEIVEVDGPDTYLNV